MRRFTVPLLAAAGFIAVLVVGRMAGIPASEFTRDVTGVVGVAPWTGVLATAGVLAWTAGASVALFAASATRTDTDLRRFLMSLGAIAGVIAMDDQFRLTQIFHNVTGIPEAALAAAYGAVLAFVVLQHRQTVARTDLPLFVTFVTLLAASAGFDVLDIRESVEDLLKFTGAVTLAEYIRRTAIGLISGTD